MGCVTLIKLLLLCVNGPQPTSFYWQISDSCSILGVLHCRVQKIYLPLDCGFENCSESALFTYSSFAALKIYLPEFCTSHLLLECSPGAPFQSSAHLITTQLQPGLIIVCSGYVGALAGHFRSLQEDTPTAVESEDILEPIDQECSTWTCQWPQKTFSIAPF